MPLNILKHVIDRFRRFYKISCGISTFSRFQYNADPKYSIEIKCSTDLEVSLQDHLKK